MPLRYIVFNSKQKLCYSDKTPIISKFRNICFAMSKPVDLISKSKTDKLLKIIFKRMLSLAIPTYFVKFLMERRFLHLGFEGTNACNANCSFCGYRFMQRKKEFMSMDLYKIALNQYIKAGGGDLSFTPTVGDPLVDPDIVPKIQLAAKKNEVKSIFMYTNGINIHRVGAENLLTSGIDRITISTYIGSKEGYQKYYGVRNYEQTMTNIAEILKISSEIKSQAKIFLALRVETETNNWKYTEEFQKIQKLIPSTRISFLKAYDNWSGLISESDIPKGATLEECLPYEDKIKSPCFELYRRMHIYPDGKVGPCQCRDYDAEIVIGDINKNTICEIWGGEELKSLRNNWKTGGRTPDVCRGCTRYQPIDTYVSKNKFNILFSKLITNSLINSLIGRKITKTIGRNYSDNFG